jgi:hypothetical protein
MNMQFVNSRYNNNNNNNRIQSINTETKNAMVQFPRIISIQRPFAHSQQQQPKTTVIPQNDPNKIRWGAPTWFLFHTIAHKIKEIHFSKIKHEILNNILIICRNLPCPKCSEHATQYISKININTIQTKDDLKNMLFKFHNDVNLKTGAELFDYRDLHYKYNNAVTVNIVHHFFMLFKDKSFNVTAIANSMHRERICLALKEWFQKNIQYFDV